MEQLLKLDSLFVEEPPSSSLQKKINQLLGPDLFEAQRIHEQGGDSITLIKDALRFLINQLWKQLRLLTSDEDLITSQLNFVLNNWSAFNQAGADTRLDDQLKTIFDKVYYQVYDYLIEQLTTQLGEVITLDPSLINLNNNISPVAKAALQDKVITTGRSLRQRQFGNYPLGTEELVNLIESALRREQLAASTQREVDERENLQLLADQLNQTRANEIIVEVSPPFHHYQTQIMLRIYTRNATGWAPLIYSLPFVDQTTENLLTKFRVNLQSNRINSVQLNEGSTVPLLKVASGDAYTIANLFPEMTYFASPLHRLSATDVMAANDQVVQDELGKVMPSVHSAITSMLGVLPSFLNSPQILYQAAEAVERLTDMATINVKTVQELTELGYDLDEIAYLRSQGLLEDALSEHFEEHIATRLGDKGIIATQESDCVHTTRAYGGTNTGEIQQIITHRANKHGIKLTEKFMGRTPDGQAIYHFVCPVCGHGTIDKCDTSASCTKCNVSYQDAYNYYDTGQLPQTKQPKSEFKPQIVPDNYGAPSYIPKAARSFIVSAMTGGFL